MFVEWNWKQAIVVTSRILVKVLLLTLVTNYVTSYESPRTTMGKLNIAHHKSYHPYRRDNIEKVRKDEEEARQKEAKEEGRMMLAVRPIIQAMAFVNFLSGFRSANRPTEGEG